MYRVIIADDEPWVTYSLVHSINWETYGFTICSTAENGLQAYEKCITMKPDALFTDIRMPGMEGPALLEKLRNELISIEVVFISGYAEFHYAQQAVRHGAFDYLLKQVSTNQLTETLLRLKKHLDYKARLSLNDAYFALLDEADNLSISEWMDCCSQTTSYSFYRFIIFTGTIEEALPLQKEMWTTDLGHVLLRTGRSRYSALVGYNNGHDFEEWFQHITPYTTDNIGVSSAVNSSFSFSVLHRQADIAFHTAQLTGQNRFYTKNISCECSITESILAFETFLKANEIAECTHLLTKLSKQCEELMLDQIAKKYNVIANLLLRYRPYEAEGLESTNYRRLGADFSNISDIFSFLIHTLQTPDAMNTNEFLGQNIIQYIDKHYTEEIRLTDLAEQYHFSPSYFSTLFRKQVGTTLTKYIVTKRIELAKQLLRESSFSIQEIVDRIGYNDYFQFIKIFKREVGITPGNYRNKL